MKNREDYQSSNWFKRIANYEDVKEQAEYFRLENERMDDNVIRRLNEIDTRLDAILFAVNTLLHSKTSRKGSNSKKKTKDDKLVKKDKKVENKAKRRGRPPKQEKEVKKVTKRGRPKKKER